MLATLLASLYLSNPNINVPVCDHIQVSTERGHKIFSLDKIKEIEFEMRYDMLLVGEESKIERHKVAAAYLGEVACALGLDTGYVWTVTVYSGLRGIMELDVEDGRTLIKKRIHMLGTLLQDKAYEPFAMYRTRVIPDRSFFARLKKQGWLEPDVHQKSPSDRMPD